MFDWLKRLFGSSGGSADDTEAEQEQPDPPGMSESGAGIRHGSTPPGYVPPVDEGRPPH